VGRIITNRQPVDHPLLARALFVAESLHVPVRRVGAGDTIDVGDAARIRVLGPSFEPAPSDDGSTVNDGSLVTRVQYGTTSLLLMGDAETAGEAGVVSRYGGAIRANVIKVGHHGSRTSSTPDLVASAATERGWAVVQVARRNRYGLPDEEPLLRWRAAGMRVVTTSSEGAIWLRSDGHQVSQVGWHSE
jgi:competence protein ComEC